jgi:hypothetical protein
MQSVHQRRNCLSLLPVFFAICAIVVFASSSALAWRSTQPQITVREYTIFDGNVGWEHAGVTYRLACGASIVQAPNGDLLCWWLSGSGTEPATDNNVLISRSCDKGKSWGEPSIWIPAGEMAAAVTSVYATSDGRLIAFGAHWPSEKRYTVWHYFRIESKDNGHNWSAPTRLVLHNEHIAFGRPIRLANGELLFAASFFDKRPQPLTASVQALLKVQSEVEALALSGSREGRHDDKFWTHRHGCSVLISPDEDAREFKEYGYIANRPLGLLEPSCLQLKDGRIVMLMRAELAGYLWRSESRDNGRTWTPAWQTDIPNPTSAIHLLRLANGRIALLHNACGQAGKMIQRDPLSLWISDDEMDSWAIKADLLHGGWLAYPAGMILDERLVFTYDRNRRQARFVEVDIADVGGRAN